MPVIETQSQEYIVQIKWPKTSTQHILKGQKALSDFLAFYLDFNHFVQITIEKVQK